MRDPDATYDCDEMWPEETDQCSWCGLEICEKPHECQDGLDEDAIGQKPAAHLARHAAEATLRG